MRLGGQVGRGALCKRASWADRDEGPQDVLQQRQKLCSTQGVPSAMVLKCPLASAHATVAYATCA